MYSSSVCPPGYAKIITKGVIISSLMCMDAQISRAQDAQERCFRYAIQANRTTLHTAQLRVLG